MEKKKKRIIIFSVLAGSLILLVLLSSAIFQIKSVSVEYRTTLTTLSVKELNSMIEEANIPYGKSIFFSSLDDNVAEMEKEHPYVKVNKIERKFPNALVVLVSERVPVVRVQANGKFYVLDNELKVLHVVSSDGEYNAQTGEHDLPLLVDESGEFGRQVASSSEGDFIKNDKVQGYVDAIYRGAVTSGDVDQSVAISLMHTINEIRFSHSKSLDAMVFDITYKDNDIKTKIIGDNSLVDDVYKVMCVITAGGDYAEVNCTHGTVYAKNKGE